MGIFLTEATEVATIESVLTGLRTREPKPVPITAKVREGERTNVDELAADVERNLDTERTSEVTPVPVVDRVLNRAFPVAREATPVATTERTF